MRFSSCSFEKQTDPTFLPIDVHRPVLTCVWCAQSAASFICLPSLFIIMILQQKEKFSPKHIGWDVSFFFIWMVLRRASFSPRNIVIRRRINFHKTRDTATGPMILFFSFFISFLLLFCHQRNNNRSVPEGNNHTDPTEPLFKNGSLFFCPHLLPKFPKKRSHI